MRYQIIIKEILPKVGKDAYEEYVNLYEQIIESEKAITDIVTFVNTDFIKNNHETAHKRTNE